MYEIFVKLQRGEYSAEAAVNALCSEKDPEKLSDSDLVKKIISRLDNIPNKEEIWETLLKYIDAEIFDDHCFNYFFENNICLNTLAHLNLQDKYLKVLLNFYDEAYIFLARRYYKNEKYSLYDFAELISKCKYESVFYDLLLNERNINPKGNIIHKVIERNKYLSGELKVLSKRIHKAKALFCTASAEMISEYYEKNDYVYMAAISRNLSAPEEILRKLSQIADVKFAARIREQSKETLRLKRRLNI